MSAVHESNTVNFKKQLLHREREKKQTEWRAAGREVGQQLVNLRKTTTGLQLYSSIALLRRIARQHEDDILLVHNKKLGEMLPEINKGYGENVVHPSHNSNIINLFRYEMNQHERNLRIQNLQNLAITT